MRIKKFNEEKTNKSDLKDIKDDLKDSLSELMDNKKVFFSIYQGVIHSDGGKKDEIKIIVELDHYFEFLGYDPYEISDADKIKKSADEISNIVELVQEGLIRSQIGYTSANFHYGDEVEVELEDVDENEDNIDYYVGDFLIFIISGIESKK